MNGNLPNEPRGEARRQSHPANASMSQSKEGGPESFQGDLEGAFEAGDTSAVDWPANWVDRLLSGVVVGLLTAICITLMLQVVMRYVFNSPLAWSEELARYLFIWLTFLGAALAYRLRAHIAVDILAEYLDRRVGVVPARVLRGAIRGVVLLFLIALLVGGVTLVQETTGQITPGLRISMAWVYLAIPVGCLIMILSAVGEAVSAWYGRNSNAGESDK